MKFQIQSIDKVQSIDRKIQIAKKQRIKLNLSKEIALIVTKDLMESINNLTTSKKSNRQKLLELGKQHPLVKAKRSCESILSITKRKIKQQQKILDQLINLRDSNV